MEKKTGKKFKIRKNIYAKKTDNNFRNNHEKKANLQKKLGTVYSKKILLLVLKIIYFNYYR